MNSEFSGSALLFGPGLPATGRRVDVKPIDGALRLSNGEIEQCVEWGTLKSRQAGFDENQVHLDWVDASGAWTLVLQDKELIRSLSAVAAFGEQWTDFIKNRLRRTRQRRWAWAGLAVFLGAPVLMLGLFVWQADRIAAWIAYRIPVAQETKLGDVIFEQLKTHTRFIEPQIPLQAVRAIGSRLTRGSSYPYRWYITDDKSVNAYAVPGGVVVIHSGLLRTAGSAEELAGVLAHEIEHVEQRHSLKNMIYSLGLKAGISLVFGNIDQHWGVRLAEHLGQLKFTREQESEADLSALDRLRTSHIDPKGMRMFFQRLSDASEDSVPALLATHPHTADRLQVIDRLLADMGVWPVESLPVDWPSVRAQIH